MTANQEGPDQIKYMSYYFGLGRTTVYELMKRELKTVKIGVRRLIPRAELTRFVADLMNAEAPAASGASAGIQQTQPA